jgi:hypothetical protein
VDTIKFLPGEDGVLHDGDNDNRSSDKKNRNNFDEHRLSHYYE